jgi:hypothetical protein
VEVRYLTAAAIDRRISGTGVLGMSLHGIAALAAALISVGRGDGTSLLFWLAVLPAGMLAVEIAFGFALAFVLEKRGATDGQPCPE